MRENGEGGESTGRALRLMQVRIKEGDGEGRFGGNVLGHLQSKEGPTRLSEFSSQSDGPVKSHVSQN